VTDPEVVFDFAQCVVANFIRRDGVVIGHVVWNPDHTALEWSLASGDRSAVASLPVDDLLHGCKDSVVRQLLRAHQEAAEQIVPTGNGLP